MGSVVQRIGSFVVAILDWYGRCLAARDLLSTWGTGLVTSGLVTAAASFIDAIPDWLLVLLFVGVLLIAVPVLVRLCERGESMERPEVKQSARATGTSTAFNVNQPKDSDAAGRDLITANQGPVQTVTNAPGPITQIGRDQYNYAPPAPAQSAAWWERPNALQFSCQFGSVNEQNCQGWSIHPSGGFIPANISWRFRMLLATTEQRSAEAAKLAGNHVAVAGDFRSLHPGDWDCQVPDGFVGLELAFEWGGDWCYELQLWPISEFPNGKRWKIGPAMVPGKQRWGGAIGPNPVVMSNGVFWRRGLVPGDKTNWIAQPECLPATGRLAYRPVGESPRSLRADDTSEGGQLWCEGLPGHDAHVRDWFLDAARFEDAQHTAERLIKQALNR